MPSQQGSIFTFFYRLPKNFAQCFLGYNFLWQVLAVGLTSVIVISGFDWAYFIFFRHTIVYALLFPSVVIGALVPIFFPLVLYGLGQRRKNAQLVNTACALGQAAMLGLFLSWFYKAITGRLPPQLPGVPPTADMSRVFDFGFLRQGIFWGWPSSHTAIAFAMALTLVALYPKLKSASKFWVLAYAFYIGLGVSMSIHWLSDAVAGAIFGSIIGSVVGKSFRNRYSSLEHSSV